MSFLVGRNKKRVKFAVEMSVLQLTDVPLLNATLFAKVRLLECGSFVAYTWHRPVHQYRVDFMKTPLRNGNGHTSTDESATNPQPLHFTVRIPFDERTGELERCRCKISLRREAKAGHYRPPTKLGFVVINLAEYAASGIEGVVSSHLLDSYGKRQDNSRLNVQIQMSHQAQDPLFKVPYSSVQHNPLSTLEQDQLNPADRKAPSSGKDTSYTSRPAKLIFDDEDSVSKDSPPSTAPPPQSKSSITTNSGATDPLTSKSTTGPGGDSLTTSQISEANPASLASATGPADRSSWTSHPGNRAASTSATPLHQMSTSWDAGSSAPTASAHSRRMSEERSLVTSSFMGGPPSSASRVQRTRRDAGGVIEEVLAEIGGGTYRRRSATATSTSDVDERGGDSKDYPRYGSVGRAGKREDPERSRGLTLYITKDGKSAAVDEEGLEQHCLHQGELMRVAPEDLLIGDEFDDEGSEFGHLQPSRRGVQEKRGQHQNT